MLKQILDAFENSPGPMRLDLLALQPNIDSNVLEGMLVELVSMGRLAKLDDRADSSCAACGVKGHCPYLLTTSGVYFALPDMITPGTPC
ncbi:MAG: FeoC-like transcriptional regulator [Chloroflexota bacterium]|nr:FeoC-like transcriptional regulator [Chloroflexota bacterium]